MKKIIYVGLLLFTFITAESQQNISGVVKNSQTKQPIEGVSILVINTTIGTTTDVKGFYQLRVPENSKYLQFSCMGMISREVPIEDKTIIDVDLEPDIFRLDDVVVTAIGIEKEEKALGYSVQELQGDEFVNVKNDNIINSLSGKVAGVQVTSSSSAAGGASYIMIRGATSLEGNNQPMFVVDGVPISNHYLQWFCSESSDRIMDLNPEDIENVSVLKGGAATALYGMRAANGVVLITTKKGESVEGRKINVNFHTSVTMEKVSQLPKLQTRYGQGSNGQWISGFPVSWGPRLDTCSYSRNEADWTYPGFDVDGAIVGQNHPNATGESVKTYDQNDFFRNAVSTFNALNLSGGNENSSFQASSSYTFTEGVVPENKWKRFTMKISGDTKLASNFRLFGSANYLYSTGDRIQSGGTWSGGVMLGLWTTPPSFDNAAGYEFPDGSQRNFQHGSGYDNPYFSVNKVTMTDVVNRLIGYTGFQWKTRPWMSVDYKIGMDYFVSDWNGVYPKGAVTNITGAILITSHNERQINSDLMLNFFHQFGDNWMMNLTLGNNMYEYYSKEITIFGIGWLIPGYYNITNSPAQFGYTYVRHYRNAAFYGDLEVTYKRMIYLTLTGRNEWSTTLPKENNSFFYPSASISWVFTELEGLQNLKALPFGKLRFSIAGIANAPEMYKTSTYYEPSFIGDTWVYGLRFPFFGIPSFDISNTLGNAELKPEKTTTWEIGTDLRFIGNRIALDFTYFNSYARDLLLNVPVAGSSGFSHMYTNTGEMSTRGIEAVLNMIPVQSRDWSWNTSFNFTRTRSVVKKLAPNIDIIALTGNDYVTGLDAFLIIYDPVIGAREGDDYQTFYGYDWLRDDNGNVIINDNPESPGYGFPMGNYDTIVNAGRFTPDWILGWSNTVSWKNLSLSFLLEFKKGGLMFNATKSELYYRGVHGDEESREAGDLVVFEGVKQSDGLPNDIQVVKDENWYYRGEGSTAHGPGVPFLEETSWIRLREIILSYQLGHEALGDGFIKSLEFYLSGQNLLLFTKYSGVDPESSATGPSNAQGFDDFNWPGTKGLTFGIKAGF